MILNYQNKFLNTEPIGREIFRLMDDVYGFYLNFYENYLEFLKSKNLSSDASGEIFHQLKEKLFDEAHVHSLDAKKEQFLALKFKLKGGFGPEENDYFYAEDLLKIVEEVSEQLQLHIEFNKYKDSALNDRSLIGFLYRIRDVQTSWNIFSAKYRFAEELFHTSTKIRPGFVATKLQFFNEGQTEGFGYMQLKSLFSFFEEILNFAYKVDPKIQTNDSIEVSNCIFGETSILQISVRSRAYPYFLTFLADLSAREGDAGVATKSAIATCLAFSNKLNPKEKNAITLTTIKKINKILTGFSPNFSFRILDPIDLRDLPQEVESPKITDPSPIPPKPEEKAVEVQTKEKNTEVEEIEPPPKENRDEKKSHISFLTA